MAVKMKIARDFGAYFKYSLHDARIKEMEYKDGSLILHFDYIFSYNEGAEHTHKAQIIFEQVDIDDVDVLVFSDTLLDDFQGKRIDFETYQSKYKRREFEIIHETFQGWLWMDQVPVHCVMNIFFAGKMIYDIEQTIS